MLLRKLIQDIHNTSLLLDDVQDNSPLRRGKPAAHTVFGPAQTINSATYKIIEIVSQAMSMTDSTEYVRAVVDGMSDLMIGQSLDLLWTQEASFPTVQEYIRMVDGSKWTAAPWHLQPLPTTLTLVCRNRRSVPHGRQFNAVPGATVRVRPGTGLGTVYDPAGTLLPDPG